MGTRRFEARLIVRLAIPTGAAILAMAVAAVALADRMVERSDTDAARSQARSAIDGLVIELNEGDSFDEGAGEVLAAAKGAGVRLFIGRNAERAGDIDLPRLADGDCTTTERATDGAWRVCGASRDGMIALAAVSIDAHRVAVRSMARAMIALVLVTLALTALAVRLALRGPLSEVNALVQWTTAILETGTSVAPPSSSTVEIERLQTAFDTLVRRILDALARERASSAHIAHELRTPLTAIVADLNRARGGDDASTEALVRVRQDAARLGDVIEAILVLSEATGQKNFAWPIVNVADVAREVASGVRIEAPEEALVHGDEQLIRLALRNLIENARKYAGGASLVRLSREGDGIRVSVIDHGPGLDAASRARMFERYWRGAADAEGRGLGLALVRATAERHGGQVGSEPADGGAGLAVWFTLSGLAEWHEGRG